MNEDNTTSTTIKGYRKTTEYADQKSISQSFFSKMKESESL